MPKPPILHLHFQLMHACIQAAPLWFSLLCQTNHSSFFTLSFLLLLRIINIVIDAARSTDPRQRRRSGRWRRPTRTRCCTSRSPPPWRTRRRSRSPRRRSSEPRPQRRQRRQWKADEAGAAWRESGRNLQSEGTVSATQSMSRACMHAACTAARPCRHRRPAAASAWPWQVLKPTKKKKIKGKGADGIAPAAGTTRGAGLGSAVPGTPHSRPAHAAHGD